MNLVNMRMSTIPEQILSDCENFPSKIEWNSLPAQYILSEEFIKKYYNRLTTTSWYWISFKQHLSDRELIEFKKDINWDIASSSQALSEKILDECSDLVVWKSVCMWQVMSEHIIEKYSNKFTEIDWKMICINQNLSESFIDKFKDKLDWRSISQFQQLSEDFIEKYKDRLDMSEVSYYQLMSSNFIIKMKDYINFVNLPHESLTVSVINACYEKMHSINKKQLKQHGVSAEAKLYFNLKEKL